MEVNGIISSTKFCHYTTIENARNILSSNCFYLSKFNNMNDLREAELHNCEKDQVFSLSFCNSDASNIPLFYLYSGIDGKGCRIQFTDAKIRSIISNCSICYVNNRMKKLKKKVSPLEYTIYYDWIYYISKSGYCKHKGSEDLQYTSIYDAIELLKKDNKHYFVKNSIWEFEKEFRIVVKFKEPIKYDKISLEFEIKDNEKAISLMCAPETNESEFYEIEDEFFDYGIKNIKMSSNLGVSMNLLQKNEALFYKWKRLNRENK